MLRIMNAELNRVWYTDKLGTLNGVGKVYDSTPLLL